MRALDGELAYLGEWTTRVARWFRAAGSDPDGDGVFGADDGLNLFLVGSPILAVERRRVAVELASLREQARRGELDMDAADLAELMARARTIVDLSDDPRGDAEQLIAAMGPGDVVTALSILESTDLDDATSLDQSVAAMRDLGHVVSLGLESQPHRAERWAEEIVMQKVSAAPVVDPGAATESIAVMGSGNAAGTSVLTAAIYGQLLTRTGPAPRGGLVDRLYGVTDPGAPILVTAAAQVEGGRRPQAPLAHAVVRETLDSDAFVVVFGAADGIAGVMPAERAYQDALGDVLAASVDHTLPGDDRAALSYDLTTTYVDVRSTPVIDTDGAFSPTVTRGLAAATQPLLERWDDDGDGRIVLEYGDGDALSVGDAVLDQALRHFAHTSAGTEGLQEALRGTITSRLADYHRPGDAALVDGPGPFLPNDLRELQLLNLHVASTVSNERFAAIVDALEQDTRLQDGTIAVVSGVLGEAPGGSTAAGVVNALLIAEADTQVTGGGNPMEGLGVHLTRDLVIHNLAGVPEFAQDEQLGALLAEVVAEEGEPGLHALLHGDLHERSDEGGPALVRLRDLVTRQEAAIGLDIAHGLGESTNPTREQQTGG